VTQTFDIRFARSTGLIGLLEAPANTFHWKGGGRLRIDVEGISFAAKRGLLSLLPHTRRVEAANLREVLREGDALRVEFTTTDQERAVVRFWARDRDGAEQIVRLLPTTRTVELEHDTGAGGHLGFRVDWRAATALVLVVAILGSVIALLQRDPTPATVEPMQVEATPVPPAAKPSIAPMSSSDAAPREARVPDSTKQEVESVGSTAPAVPAPGDRGIEFPRADESTGAATPTNSSWTADDMAERSIAIPSNISDAVSLWNLDITPFPIGRQEYQHALIVLNDFEKWSRPLIGAYGRIRSVSVDESQALVEATEMAWWEITFSLLDDERLMMWDMADFRAALLASARHQRHYLALLANTASRDTLHFQYDMRTELSLASEALAHAKRYVR
jgi:hypothetical protein